MASVSILAVRPHPDDECTGTGGIIAHYVNRNVPVGVLTCTLGEEGEILDPTLDPVAARPRLGQIREQELRAACTILGVSELRLLGYRDSGMQGTEANQRPDAFVNQPLDEAGARVAAIIRELRPRVVITENEQGTYGHPDHVMCHKVAVRGVELARDPALRLDGLEPWSVDRLYANELVLTGRERIANMLKAENLDLGWFGGEDDEQQGPPDDWGIKPEDANAAVDVRDSGDRLREALIQHHTQIPPDFFLLKWPLHIVREAFGTAYFRQLSPTPSGPQLHDLLEGLPA